MSSTGSVTAVTPSRRKLLQTAAWTAPAVTLAVAAPASAASTGEPRVVFTQSSYEVPMPPGAEFQVSGWLEDAAGQRLAGIADFTMTADDFAFVTAGSGTGQVVVATTADGSFRLRVVATEAATVSSRGSIVAKVQGATHETPASLLPAQSGRVSLSQVNTNVDFGRGPGDRTMFAVIAASGLTVTGAVALTFVRETGVFPTAQMAPDTVPADGWSISGVGTNTLVVQHGGGLADGASLRPSVVVGHDAVAEGTVAVSTSDGAAVTPSEAVVAYFS